MSPQSVRLKNSPLPGLGLKSNMTTKGPLPNHVSTESDGWGLLCFTGYRPVIPSEGGIVLSCRDTPKVSIKCILKILVVQWGKNLLLDIMDRHCP